MFSIVRISRRALLGLALGFPHLIHAQTGPAGATTGQFAVQSGTASYTVPLALPPGLGEMKPELSLIYNSNGGDGPLGQGWSLSGLSAISLCPQTVAQDGKHVPVAASTPKVDRRFCLDGQRLVKTGGTFGGATLVMRPEIDSFAQVKISGWSPSQSVPSSFVVKTKAGQSMFYGETDLARSHNEATFASTPAIAWFVSRMVDAADNTIAFNYRRSSVQASSGATPETLIDTISYGYPKPDGEAYATIEFTYEPRQSLSYYSAAGYRFERRERLASITTKVRGQPVRTYVLGYGQLTRTGSDVLQSIKECAPTDAPGSCLPETRFSWNQNDIGMWAENQTTGSSWGGSDWVRTGDFNGDGLTDIASPSGSQVHIQFAKPFGGFRSESWYTSSNWSSVEHLLDQHPFLG